MIDNLMVRWLTRRDMAEVLKIESASFELPWCDDDFMSVLRQRNCIGVVAEQGNKIVGFMIYELAIMAFHLLCSSKKGFSALQLQRELKLGSYKTAWFMMHRIRFAM